MGLMHPVPRSGHRTGSPWPRRQRRRWLRGDDVVTAGQLLAAIPSLPRAELSRLTDRLIDRMDELDGDADVEANGDELDGTGGEDDFVDHSANWLGYPGCPVSDPGEDDHLQEQERAYE